MSRLDFTTHPRPLRIAKVTPTKPNGIEARSRHVHPTPGPQQRAESGGYRRDRTKTPRLAQIS
jgi:hypothetical protein